MRRMLVLAAAAALTLAAAPSAPAKEVKQVQVCGPDACGTVDDEQARAALADGGPPRTPPTAAPYYDVRVTVSDGREDHDWSYAAVPSKAAALAEDGTWMDMPASVTAIVRKAAADLKPFPATNMVGWAAPEEPQPAPAADAGSPLWPEGMIVAIVALLAALAIVRFSGRFKPASG